MKKANPLYERIYKQMQIKPDPQVFLGMAARAQTVGYQAVFFLLLERPGYEATLRLLLSKTGNQQNKTSSL